MKLVVIEGPGKRETLQKYLGEDYKVIASKGHVRDLPKNSFGVNLKTFEPIYEILSDKKEVEKELKTMAKKASEVLIATDPDREGEAISWHIAHILDIDQKVPCRIEFNEISKDVVLAALKKPRTINLNLVDAQQARRVLDRIVGYKLSPILGKKIRSKLSAGRVQSVALKMIVEREREVLNFKPEEYWNISAILSKNEGLKFKANLTQISGKKAKITNKEQADAVEEAVKNANWKVVNIKKTQTKSHAPAPFITSSMQQDAINKLGMNLQRVSMTAQQLYEGVEISGEGKTALITYIRTDSTRISETAQTQAKEHIIKTFGKEFAPAKFNNYVAKKSAQDAHEAIRPIHVDIAPESVEGKISNDCYKLYKLIYERFLASQMSEAVFNNVSVDIEVNNHTFRATGKTPVFAGFLAVYQNYEETNDEEKDPKIPALSENDLLVNHELKKEQKFTKPPARYTEGTLVESMEKVGIGRPATYAPTITTLAQREYTDKEGKYLKPTELGITVTDYLDEHFKKFINVEFTAKMEGYLDEIAEGEKDWKAWIEKFWLQFSQSLELADENSSSLKVPPIETDKKCPKCGANLFLREGRFGKFLACSAFPKCKYTEKLESEQEKAEPKQEPVLSDEVCSKCGAKMYIRQGKYGPYLACSAFPKCKNIQRIKKVTADSNSDKKDNEKEQSKTQSKGIDSGKKCSKCGKPMMIKEGRYGQFLACSGFPKCRNIERIEKGN